MPLDENLPVFLLAKSSKDVKNNSTFYLTRGGSEPEPAYSLRYADPTTSKNCYAVALFDPYNPDVLFGEVLLRPQWTHTTLSQEEIRKNGGIPPPPEPLMPHEFTIQLYNPDQQVVVTHKQPALLGSVHWDFSMPQDTFRPPSTSILDLSRSDPGAASTTPRINFSWKKETKLSRDLTCVMTGKSTDILSKKKNKEADITIALFKSVKEITIYEPNLYRVEMEDPKGLEVVLLLTAAVIRDVFFGSIKHAFNISQADRRSSAPTPILESGLADLRHPANQPLLNKAVKSTSAAVGALYQRPAQQSIPSSQFTNIQSPQPDPRAQWEIDNETARLKAQAEFEARERQRLDALRRRERDREAEEETKRLRKMVEREEKERQQKQREIDKETERLRKLYGLPESGNPPNLPMRSKPNPSTRLHQTHSAPIPQTQFAAPNQYYMHGANDTVPPHFPPQPQRLPSGLYVQPTQFYNNSANALRPNNTGPAHGWNQSRGLSDQSERRTLNKKSSTIW